MQQPFCTSKLASKFWDGLLLGMFAHLGHLLHEARSCDDYPVAASFDQFYPSNHGLSPNFTIQLLPKVYKSEVSIPSHFIICFSNHFWPNSWCPNLTSPCRVPPERWPRTRTCSPPPAPWSRSRDAAPPAKTNGVISHVAGKISWVSGGFHGEIICNQWEFQDPKMEVR